VIVVTEAADPCASVARSFEGVEVAALDRRASAGRARGIGRSLVGEEAHLLLFVDADCELEAGAVARLAAALERERLAAACAAIEGEGGGAVGWLRHLLEFKDFAPGVPPPAAGFVPSAALLVRAAAYDRAGGFPDMWPGEDLVFCRALEATGGRLGKVDGARARHLHPGGLGAFLAHQYRLGATSARARLLAAGMRGSAFARHRWLAPLLFFGRAVRGVAWVVRFRRRELWRLAALSPLYAAGLGAWTVGFASAGSAATVSVVTRGEAP
jgi:GT2 family glycosyltransferase